MRRIFSVLLPAKNKMAVSMLILAFDATVPGAGAGFPAAAVPDAVPAAGGGGGGGGGGGNVSLPLWPLLLMLRTAVSRSYLLTLW